MSKLSLSEILQNLFPTLDLQNPEDVQALAGYMRQHKEQVNEAIRKLLASTEGMEREPDEELDALL